MNLNMNGLFKSFKDLTKKSLQLEALLYIIYLLKILPRSACATTARASAAKSAESSTATAIAPSTAAATTTA
jgi:hypothetical protein